MCQERKHIQTNHRSWNDRVPVHFASAMYREHLDALKAGGHCLEAEVLDEVGDVSGKTLLHLQCHFGLDTLSWARRGAAVTGLDFSEPAIELARQLSEELTIPAEFVCANVYDAAEALDGPYDVVFTSLGVLGWLPNLPRWADNTAKLLKPGGLFYLMDCHPFTDVFDDDASAPQGLTIGYDYFDTKAYKFEAGPTYADNGTHAVVGETVEWMHTFSSILNALIDAGLRIERVFESPRCHFGMFDVMREVSPNRYEMPAPLTGKLPLVFSLRATKPA